MTLQWHGLPFRRWCKAPPARSSYDVVENHTQRAKDAKLLVEVIWYESDFTLAFLHESAFLVNRIIFMPEGWYWDDDDPPEDCDDEED